MPDTHIDQQGSEVSGHQAGRDVVDRRIDNSDHSVHIHYCNAATPLGRRIERYKIEVTNGYQIGTILESLQHYHDNVDGPAVIGLDEKLRRANREDEIEIANKLKELFCKKLVANQLFKSAQEIFVVLLGIMYEQFQCHVRPLINGGATTDEINAAVLRHVIQPLFDKIEAEDNALTLLMPDLRGMFYFLTGNCHIKWN